MEEIKNYIVQECGGWPTDPLGCRHFKCHVCGKELALLMDLYASIKKKDYCKSCEAQYHTDRKIFDEEQKCHRDTFHARVLQARARLTHVTSLTMSH